MAGHGLHVLFDSGKDSADHSAAEIDIVAVHGLNFRNHSDYARDTWRAGDSLWLKDFLPTELAKPARVMLFSYNSSPAKDAAAIKLDDHATNLLQWLNIERENVPRRPIVFICHSLGGLVVKEALVEATLDVTYKSVVESTRLLVFFATPHRGGNYASIGKIVANIVRAGLWKPNNKLLNALKKNSDDATKRFGQSRHLYEQCLVLNFYEGEPYGKFGIIVDKDSATLGLPGSREKQIAMHANHSTICKFDSVNTPARRLVLGTIVKEIYRSLQIESKNVHWLVSRSVNSMFTGRRKIIAKIKNAVTQPTSHSQRRFVLTGMGGQGKSEICLKVADELREEFWAVFWVDVSSDSTAKAGFSSIAKMLGSAETGIDEARRSLSNVEPKHPWLLILDNADNPQVDYQQYCPSGTRGTVLITSRITECQRFATVGSEDLGSLDEQDCIHLLLRAAGLTPDSPTVNSDAKKVLAILGSHTLAILQASAYIAKGECDLSEYPDVFQKQSERLLKFNLTQDQSRYRSIYATLEASAEILDALRSDPQQSVCAQDSICLLQALSPLHYENVPLDIFRGAWKGSRKVIKRDKDNTKVGICDLTDEHVSQLPDFIQSRNDTWDSFRLSQAVSLLESLALLRKNNAGGYLTVSMHSLTHNWVNLRQNLTERNESLRKGRCIVALSRYCQHSWVPYRNRLGPHLLSLLERNTLNDEGWSESLLPIYLQLGWLLHDLRYDERLKEHLQYIFAELHINHNIVTAKFSALFNLSTQNALVLGNVKNKIRLLKHKVLIREKTLSKTHPDRLASQHELAGAYLKDGQIEKAIHLFQHVIRIKKIKLNETHPDRLASQHELAGAYLKDGQIEKAIHLFQHVIRIKKIKLNETHPSRLTSQHELARAYLKDGQIQEAINLLQYVVRIKETTLSETHPDRLGSQHELARAYLKDGQIQEAINLFQHVVRIKETTLSETHPDRLGSQHELARAYLKNGQILKAIDLLQYVVRIQETTLNETHPSRLTSQHELARAYLKDGQIQEAINLLQYVVRIKKITLSETHPSRLTSQHELARAYLKDGQIQEAIDLFQHVVRIQETTLNETHPRRLASQRILTVARQAYAEMAEPHPASTSHAAAEQLVPQESKRQKIRHAIAVKLKRVTDSLKH